MKFLRSFPPYFGYLVQMCMLQLLLFTLLRLVFFFFTSPDSGGASFGLFLQIFLKGGFFDLSVSCYLSAIPFLLFWFASFLKNGFKLEKFSRFLLKFLILFSHFIFLADVPYFNQFGSHLSKNVFLWNQSFGTMFHLIFENLIYWGYLLLFIAWIFPMLYLFKKVERFSGTNLFPRSDQRFVVRLLFGLLTGLLLAVGARGRIFRLIPLHEGFAVVSENAYLNQLALNPNFTFGKSVLFNRSKPYVIPENIKEYLHYTQRFLGISDPHQSGISRWVAPQESPRQLNVVLVIMESMAHFKMGHYNGKDLTPYFHELCRESVYFDRFFSSGIHTFNGVFSSSCGFPAVLDEQPLLQYNRKAFPNLAAVLRKAGYETAFMATQDPQFDNMGGFMQSNGHSDIVGVYDFPSGQSLGSMGVPDHVLYDRVIRQAQDYSKQKHPFLITIMTGSDHGPWKIPNDIPFKPNGASEPENSTLYADWAIGQLIQKAKKESWYPNTVFVFVGDHGLAMGHTYDMPLSYHHVPFVIHHPALLNAQVYHHPGYQPDIQATILGLLKRPYLNETFGIDLLQEKHPFVFFTADDKIGAIDSNGYYYYELLSTGMKRLRKYENLDPADYRSSLRNKADSLAYGSKALLETARYLMHQSYSRF